MIFNLLMRHQWRRVVRTFVWRRHWLITVLLSLLILYILFSLAALGFLWQEMVRMVRPRVDPVAFLNRHLLTLFLGLFTLRFFVQRTPRIRIRPYLHLPLSRRSLIRFFQVSSLATIHNVFPFLFFLPLWLRHIQGGPYGPAASLGWLSGVVLLLLLSHFANTLLRSLLSRSRDAFFMLFGGFMFVVALDLFYGPGLLNTVSFFVFDTLVSARPVVLVLLSLLVLVVFLSSSLLLRQDLLSEERDSRHRRVVLWQVPFLAPNERLLNLLLLELKLMWRCERPKLYFLLSVVFVLVYVAIPLIRADLMGSTVVRALTVLFASGIFAFNYGQLMFSWESSYFDGMMTRSYTLREMVMAKLILLQGSCVVFFLLSLPLFVMLSPDLIREHVTFLCYNLGVSTVLIMMVALNNHRRVALTHVGFFNFEGFSILHWLWYIPTVAPPAMVMWIWRDAPTTALMVIGTVGILCFAFTPQWATYFARHLKRQRYVMAAGFRQSA